MNTDLTKVQAETLDYIRCYRQGHDGRSPTRAEIAQRFRITNNAAHERVQRLAAHGLISIQPGARGIVIHDQP